MQPRMACAPPERLQSCALYLVLAAVSAAVWVGVGMGGVEAVDDGVVVGEAFSLGAGQAAHAHDDGDMVFEDLAHVGHGFRRASTARLASSRLALGLLERKRPTVRSTALNLRSLLPACAKRLLIQANRAVRRRLVRLRLLGYRFLSIRLVPSASFSCARFG
jgi:hypothetical protein